MGECGVRGSTLMKAFIRVGLGYRKWLWFIMLFIIVIPLRNV